jgi:hypothetical protein
MEQNPSPKRKWLAPAAAVAAAAALLAALLGWLVPRGGPSGPFGTSAAEAPRAVRYVVSVALGSSEVFPEMNLALDKVILAHGNADEGGIIRRVPIPANFEADHGPAAQALMEQGKDLDVRALVVAPAFRGTLDAFARLKKQRPDMLLLALDSREDPGPMSMYSDLTVDADFVHRGYFLAQASKGLGVSKALYVTAEQDLESPKARRLLAVFREAAAAQGIGFIELVAGPGLGEGAAGAFDRAEAWVSERCQGWVSQFGPGVIFYAPSAPLAKALLRCAAFEGGYFLEAPRPSPYLYFPELFGLPAWGGPEAQGLSSRAFAELLGKKAGPLPFKGRLGVWPVSFGNEALAALAELAVQAAGGGAAVSEPAFMEILSAGNPDGLWTRRELPDAVTGRRVKKHVLLSSDIEILGGEGFSLSQEAVPPKYLSIQPPPAPGDEVPFHIGILTGTEEQGADDYLGAREFRRLRGDAGEGGMVRLAVYEESGFASKRTEALLTELAADPLMKVIVVNQAVPGTAEGFRRLKEFRQDILLFAMETHEEPPVITAAADLVVTADYIGSGYLIPLAAKGLGADALVHVSFPRHLSYGAVERRLAIMRAASADLGLGFHEETALDPMESGVEAARASISGSYPQWLEKYGPNAAYFSTNDSHTGPLIRAAADLGGYFVQADIPSPFVGYPQAFGMDPAAYGYRWMDYIRDLERKVVEAGAGGRLGTWIFPVGFCESMAAAEFGRRVVLGEARRDDIKALLDTFAAISEGAAWNGSFLTDPMTGKPISNYFLVYQDTYVFGKGFLSLSSVEIPLKYLLQGTGMEIRTGPGPEGSGGSSSGEAPFRADPALSGASGTAAGPSGSGGSLP